MAPARILPAMRGRYGLSVARTLAATLLLAVSLGLMKLVPNLAIGAAVIPLWAAAVGTLIDGKRGAARGLILAIVYPLYLSFLLAAATLVFWGYALLHRLIAGSDLLT